MKSDVVVPPEELEKLSQIKGADRLLKEGRVMVITDTRIGAGEGRLRPAPSDLYLAGDFEATR